MTPIRLALAWSAFVLLLCTIPGDTFVTPDFQLIAVDKLAHLVLFLGIGLLWTRAVPKHAALVFVCGVAFGIGIEVLQGLLPIGRAPELADALADVVGLTLGIGAGWLRLGAE